MKWLHREHEAKGWLLEIRWWEHRGQTCSGRTPGPLRSERMANEQDTRRGCKGQRDLILLIGCWTARQLEYARFLHHPPSATSRLGYCHGKRPLSTIGDKWGQTSLKVNHHLREGHRRAAILIPYTLRVIKTHPEREGELIEFFETANEMLICWPSRNELWGTQGHKRGFIHTFVGSSFYFSECVCRCVSKCLIVGPCTPHPTRCLYVW